MYYAETFPGIMPLRRADFGVLDVGRSASVHR